MGNRPRLTQEQVAELANDLRKGEVSKPDLAKKYGVAENTIYAWSVRLRKGMQGKNGHKNGAHTNGANGTALEDAIINLTRNRLRADPAFAETLVGCLSPKS